MKKIYSYKIYLLIIYKNIHNIKIIKFMEFIYIKMKIKI